MPVYDTWVYVCNMPKCDTSVDKKTSNQNCLSKTLIDMHACMHVYRGKANQYIIHYTASPSSKNSVAILIGSSLASQPLAYGRVW